MTGLAGLFYYGAMNYILQSESSGRYNCEQSTVSNGREYASGPTQGSDQIPHVDRNFTSSVNRRKLPQHFSMSAEIPPSSGEVAPALSADTPPIPWGL
jgi:hypothetical protein